jgi:apolipoprotein N-acyltransferase
MKNLPLVLAAVASAACTLLSTAPVGSGLAALVAPLLLILIANHARSSRSAILIVFLTQIPLWLWLHRWVEDIAGVGWIGLGLYMSMWAPIFVYLLRRIQSSKAFPEFSIVFVAPIVWVGLECVRGIILFDGYPWYLVGTGIVDTPFVHIASYGSVWLASFLVVMFAAALATLNSVKLQTWIMFAIIGLLIFNIFPKLNPPIYFSVAVVQTNVPQSNKVAWTWDRQQQDVSRAIELTYKAIKHANPKPHLVVWPETMLPGVGFEVDRFDFAPWDQALRPYWHWAEVIRKLAAEIDIPILVGSQTWLDVKVESEVDRLHVKPSSQFNSAVLVFPDGHTERYDKTFLTPFGERMPYVERWDWLNDKVRGWVGAAMLFDLDAGSEPHRLTVPHIPDPDIASQRDFQIGTPICFEDTVPHVVRDLVWEDGERQVELLINLSNDGWFGEADDARLQHIREARMRCIENWTPMIRVANTGMSCEINGRGVVVKQDLRDSQLALRESGFALFTATMGLGKPISARVGDSVAWICLIASILFLVGSHKRSAVDEETSV